MLVLFVDPVTRRFALLPLKDGPPGRLGRFYGQLLDKTEADRHIRDLTHALGYTRILHPAVDSAGNLVSQKLVTY